MADVSNRVMVLLFFLTFALLMFLLADRIKLKRQLAQGKAVYLKVNAKQIPENLEKGSDRK